MDNRSGRQATRFEADQHALVDELWKSMPGTQNVTLKGRTLAVTLGARDIRTTCEEAARVASAYGTDIDSVTLTQAGHPGNRCIAPVSHALVRPALLNVSSVAQLEGLSRPPALTIDAASPTRQQALAQIKTDAAKQEIIIEAVSLSESEAILYYDNSRYFHETEAVDRLVRVLLADAPSSVEEFPHHLHRRRAGPVGVRRSARANRAQHRADWRLWLTGRRQQLFVRAAGQSFAGLCKPQKLPAFFLGALSAVPPTAVRPPATLSPCNSWRAPMPPCRSPRT